MIIRNNWGYIYQVQGLAVGATELSELVGMLKRFGIESGVAKPAENPATQKHPQPA